MMDYIQSGDPMDYVHSIWRSDGLCTQSGDQTDYAYTVWRSDGLCTHSLEIRWTVHTKPGDKMKYLYSLEIR
jgi:hypothetical protein